MKSIFVLGLVIALSACTAGNYIHIPSYENLGKSGATLNGQIFKPEGDGPFPAVLLMHGCAGLSDATRQGLKGHAKFLVDNGYVAVIVDSYSTREISVTCKKFDQIQKARFYRKQDAYNTLRYLKSLTYIDSQNFYLVGLSQGGRIALLVSSASQYPAPPEDVWFNAVVAFYPYCERFPKRLITPVLVLVAELDDWVSPGTCLAMQGHDLGQPYRVISYKGAHHGFDLFIPVVSYLGHTVGGNAKARQDSRKQMLTWFENFRL